MILLRIKIGVFILMQIVMTFCQDEYKREAGGEAKLLTEKTCKFDQEAVSDHSKLSWNFFYFSIFQIRNYFKSVEKRPKNC